MNSALAKRIIGESAMEKSYRYFLVKTEWSGRRPRLLRKTLTVQASNAPEAANKVAHSYPDWQVSMFWPIWSPQR